ncbi:hypothetical protein LOD99_3196 [Oopsacas minuta]|uniref:Actin n=1 Tax=Oopsacas minuta TaxID=111878 RepID=A0AAV7JXT3_9METZ|nr:hypothetical protein LOD99_3196 [Oopsacas minuta]
MSVDKLSSIVLDNGSGCIKAGLSLQESPSFVFPSVVGTHKVLAMRAYFPRSKFCAHEAISKRAMLVLKYPIEHGVVTDWDNMEELWHHTFYDQLHVYPEEHSLLITEPPLNPKTNREKTTQIMFETFNTPKLYVSNTSQLALYASGRCTGIVIDSGEGVTYSVPVFNGHIQTDSILRLDIAGRDITDYLMKIFCEENPTFFLHNSINKPLINTISKMKESLAFVSNDFGCDLEKSYASAEFERAYTLPDGAHLATIAGERFRCVEPLFNPSLIGQEYSGIHDLAYNSITKCDNEIQQYLYGNIVLSGGNTLFPGMAERVHKEMSKLAPHNTRINVMSPSDRKYSSWIGGSLLARSDHFDRMCISRFDYDEYGSSLIHRKSYFIDVNQTTHTQPEGLEDIYTRMDSDNIFIWILGY